MNSRTRMALGLAGGYLLGRRHKAGLLLAVVGVVASRGLGEAVSRRGTAALESSPELQELAQQTRQTAVALMGRPIQGLTDRVHATTEALRSGGQGQAAGAEAEEQQPEGEQKAEAEEQQPEGEQKAEAEEQQPEGEEKAEAEEQQPEGEEKAEGAGGGRRARTQVAGRPRGRR